MTILIGAWSQQEEPAPKRIHTTNRLKGETRDPLCQKKRIARSGNVVDGKGTIPGRTESNRRVAAVGVQPPLIVKIADAGRMPPAIINIKVIAVVMITADHSSRYTSDRA
jgi:hypothetical protein